MWKVWGDRCGQFGGLEVWILACVFDLQYAHPPQDTPSFCSQVLTSPDLVTYINDHFVCWGGDVQQPDAFQV